MWWLVRLVDNRKSLYPARGTMCKEDYRGIMTVRRLAIWTHRKKRESIMSLQKKKVTRRTNMGDALCSGEKIFVQTYS